MKRSITTWALLLLATAVLSGKPVHAAETTFGAGAVVNPVTGLEHDIREVIHVTLSSSSSVWDYTDFNAFNLTTDNGYGIRKYVNDTSSRDDLFEFGNGNRGSSGGEGMPNGTYNCYAIARFHSPNPGGMPTFYDVGTTAKQVVINIVYTYP